MTRRNNIALIIQGFFIKIVAISLRLMYNQCFKHLNIKIFKEDLNI